nr:serine protease inhibitor dipetalogastin-like isoform X1 [Crassostrea gigas]
MERNRSQPTDTDMKTGLIIVGAVLAAVALCDARSPPRPQVCTTDWKPVCGVDNKTYGNVCMAKAKGVPIAKPGECKKCPCPKIMKPVCGVNKVTYDNKCLAECAGVMFFPGPCKRRTD